MNDLSVLNYLVILFVATCITHGLLLCNDGIYWDGWFTDRWQQQRDWRTMRRFYSQVGMPILYYQHRLMAYLPHRRFCYKLLAFGSIYIGTSCVFLICVRFTSLTDFEALCISLLMLSYPGQQIAVEPVISMQYVMPQAAFYVACLIGLCSEPIFGDQYWVFGRIVTMALFLLSFNMNSLLVYYWGYILLLFLTHTRVNGADWGQLVLFVGSHMDYLMLPVVFWLLKERFSPRWGVHEHYNSLKWKSLFSRSHYRSLLLGTAGQVYHSIRYLAVTKSGNFLLIILALCFVIALIFDPQWLSIDENSEGAPLLLYGIFSLGCAAVPYILVGQPFGLQGWETKNNLLLSLPTALVIMAANQIVVVPEYRSWFLAALLCAFVLRSNYNYFLLHAVWLKHLSFLRKLSRIRNAKEHSILGVHDLHLVKISLAGHPEHPSGVLCYMFADIWNSMTRLGIQVMSPDQRVFTPQQISQAIHSTEMDWLLTDINKEGEQGLITIRDGSATHGLGSVVAKYLVYRMFFRYRIPAFLDSLASVTFSGSNEWVEEAVNDRPYGAI